eukprot:2944760-Pyramimonas_sp.AAC.1
MGISSAKSCSAMQMHSNVNYRNTTQLARGIGRALGTRQRTWGSRQGSGGTGELERPGLEVTEATCPPAQKTAAPLGRAQVAPNNFMPGTSNLCTAF